MSGQVRAEKVLTETVAFDGGKYWICKLCSEINVWTRWRCRRCRAIIPSRMCKGSTVRQTVVAKAGTSSSETSSSSDRVRQQVDAAKANSAKKKKDEVTSRRK